jgi:hypothetical protein
VHKIPFVAIGAGHGSASSLGGIKNGIQIDLGHFRYANLSADNNFVIIGGATKLEMVWDALYAAGKEIGMHQSQASVLDSLTTLNNGRCSLRGRPWSNTRW